MLFLQEVYRGRGDVAHRIGSATQSFILPSFLTARPSAALIHFCPFLAASRLPLPCHAVLAVLAVFNADKRKRASTYAMDNKRHCLA